MNILQKRPEYIDGSRTDLVNRGGRMGYTWGEQ